MGKAVLSATKLRRRGAYLKGAALGTLGFCTRSAVDTEGLRPQWVEITETDLSLGTPGHGLGGIRIVQISDIHCSRTVSTEYLRRCIALVNLLEPDIVLLTGDYITYDIQGRYRQKVIEILSGVRAGFGVYACLGNHDYGLRSLPADWRNLMLSRMVRNMESIGITVLRNDSTVVDVDGRALQLVGLGDLQMEDFQPDKAFAGVSPGQATIAMVHNPRAAEHLRAYPAGAVLSGHTHGVKRPAVHKLNVKRRRFHAGMYNLAGRNLYVNRGLGRVGRLRLNARPEITVHVLS